MRFEMRKDRKEILRNLRYHRYDFQHFFVDFIITRIRYYHRYTRGLLLYKFRSTGSPLIFINNTFTMTYHRFFSLPLNKFAKFIQMMQRNITAYCSYKIDNNTHRFVSI